MSGDDVWEFIVEWVDAWDGLMLREVYELVDVDARCIYTATFTNAAIDPYPDEEAA